MKKYLFLILLPIIFYSCKNNSKTEKSENQTANKKFEKIDSLQWLLGTWINENEKEFSQETWSRENDSTFTAFSFTQVKNETVFAETLALEEKGGNLLLTAATVGQNEDQPVSFRMVSSENGQFTFENKNHDFPQRIIYTNPAKDSLHAWIEGNVDSKPKKTDFYFSRKKGH